MPLLDSFQTVIASAGRQYRATRKMARTGVTVLTGYSPYVPKHLLIAPQNLRTSDASLAEEYYAGRYVFAGELVETKGASPFGFPGAGSDWNRELHSFRWLQNLSARGDALSGSHAQAMVREWMELDAKSPKNVVWDTETAAARLISWLQNSMLILSVPNYDFHQEFMQNLGSHARYLKRYASSASSGIPRLMAYLALAYASVCFEGRTSRLNFAGSRLDEELDTQILPDGSHISRNPYASVEILTYLLPYRQSIIATGKEPSPSVLASTERLLHGLRFHRLGDGHLARFNGCGSTETDLVATLLRYDESVTNELVNSSSGGYERFESGETILIFDAGRPPKGTLSNSAHAGSLSFEFSSGADCIVVNSGVPVRKRAEIPAQWRSSATHSTSVVCDSSSCKFENTGQTGSLMEGQLFSGPLKLESVRLTDEQYEVVTASHQGYVREFGIRHERTLKMHRQNGCIEGRDWYSGPDKEDLYYTTKDAVTIHFHLHPNVEVEYSQDGNDILVRSLFGKTWSFSCEEITPEIEDSIYFAGLANPLKTKQITLRFHACKNPEINWKFAPLNS